MKSYFDLFRWEKKFENLPSVKVLTEYLLNDETYCKYFKIGKYNTRENEEGRKFWNDFTTFYHLTDFIDGFIYNSKNTEFNKLIFEQMFKTWKNRFQQENLNLIFYIPILMVTFDFDNLKISDNVSIVRMDKNFQKARNYFTKDDSHIDLVSAATHAFRISSYSIVNETEKSIESLFYKSAFSNVVNYHIDRLFGYLRVAITANTGYAQIITVPVGWTTSFNHGLHQMFIASIRSYPEYFEDNYWTEQPEKYTTEMLDIILFEKVLGKMSNNLLNAIKRLNNACLRRHNDDSILDISIGLEGLFLESKDNNEITHKLATRAAALCKIVPIPHYTPIQVFQLFKKIYNHRSTVVHNRDSKELEKSRVIKMESLPELPTLEAGMGALAHSIKSFLLHPELLQQGELDNILLK